MCVHSWYNSIVEIIVELVDYGLHWLICYIPETLRLEIRCFAEFIEEFLVILNMHAPCVLGVIQFRSCLQYGLSSRHACY